jgi:phosphoribosylaminoimidazole-succinocarboxamide synthase
MLCGVSMPEGLIENAPFPIPVITPSTKASEGHDEDISFEEAIATGLITQNEAIQLQSIALRLFERGTKLAADRGLILVDTKYEFGRSVKGEVILIDEIHTPDSSRYFEASDYEERMKQGIRPRQLSKEFVREWLIAEGFQGKEGESIPEMTENKVKEIQERYIELYQRLTGRVFVEPETSTYETMEEKVIAALNRMTNNS